MHGEQQIVRERLGFIYASTGASIYLGFLLQYVFLRKEKGRIWEYAILELVNIFLYLKTNSRMPFFFGTAILIFFLIETILKNHWRIINRLKGFMIAIPWVVCILALLGGCLYDPASAFWGKIDLLLTNRLALGNSAISG